MKKLVLFTTLTLACAFTFSAIAEEKQRLAAVVKKGGFKKIFNGKDLSGWKSHFLGIWSEDGVSDQTKGVSHYVSDLLGELDPGSPRFTRGRSPLSVCDAKGTDVSSQEWLMSPFFEAGWWGFAHTLWSVNGSEPPATGWSAHNGGRNQLYLDLHAAWVRKNIDR